MRRLAIINPDTPHDILFNLKKYDIRPIPVPKTDRIAVPIAGHPDMQVFHIDNKLFCQPEIDKKFISAIDRYVEVIPCSSLLKEVYPHDIWYNIAYTGTHAFHFRPYTDNTIEHYLHTKNTVFCNVKQGYTKCSTMIIDHNSLITSDTTIYRAALQHGLKALLIKPGFIDLPGYKYGFIGGSSGRFNNTILLTGQITHHPDHNNILQFIDECGKKTVYLSQNKALDIGSIFILDVE